MKKIFGLILALTSTIFLFSQDSTIITPLTDTLPPVIDTVPEVIDTLPITDPSILIEETQSEQRRRPSIADQLNMAGRSRDHLLIQIGLDSWANRPDSIDLKGLSRSFNIYFMFDFPFKTNPRLSVAIGAGVSTSNMYFSDTYIDLAGRNADQLTFTDVSDTTHFKKFKLLTTFLEAPVELRYVKNPAMPRKSLKAALGFKVGTLISATTKGKNILSSQGQTINSLTQKEKSRRFLNSTRISATGRVGFGNLSLFGSYQINTFVKEGQGPDVRPYSVGLTISGL